MRRPPIELVEYGHSLPEPLSIEEVADLQAASGDKLRIEPSGDRYVVTASSYIGHVATPTVSVVVQPKISLRQVMFLISYALDPKHWEHSLRPEFSESDTIVEAVVPSFNHLVGKAVAQGLLQGYRVEEDSLLTVRGRIRIEDQVRQRFGRPFPIEVRFDEFTEDIELNRVLKAAVTRLSRLRMRHPESAQGLRRLSLLLLDVADVEFEPNRLPEFVWDRLNERYRPAIELAKLILSGSVPELGRGEKRSSAFFVDMNDVFEKFVWTALREYLGVPVRSFPRGASGHYSYLDAGERVPLKPDLSWWHGNNCQFVGDLKYKRIKNTEPNADVYQMLAYTTATSLRHGLIIYGEGPRIPTFHHIPRADKVVEIHSLDLHGSPYEILEDVGRLAQRVREIKALQAEVA